MTTHIRIVIASKQKSREHQSYFSEGNEIIRIASSIEVAEYQLTETDQEHRRYRTE